MNNVAASNHASRIRLLVAGLTSKGVNVPVELTKELAIADQVNALKAKRDMERSAAINALTSVPAEEYEEAFSRAQALWADSDPMGEFIARTEASQQVRLQNALILAGPQILADITDRINQVVSEYRLNDLALPVDLNEINVMHAQSEDLDAVMTFRTAAPLLNDLWSSYRGIAKELGYDFAAKEYSSAMDVAFLVSDVDSMAGVDRMAIHFNALRSATENLKNVKPLGVFGVVNLLGYRIEMKSIAEAQYRRQEVQFPAVQAESEPTYRAAGFLLR